jgi:predicted DNA-binding helix-hairpin-helix protein
MLEKGLFFIRNICAFLRIYKKNFVAGLFSLSGLSREIRWVWDNMLKMLSWSFG